ncbi:MAG: SPOR domain-containing protein [Paracoccaceae bacterium]
MRVTRIIALAIIAGTIGLNGTQAQTLKDAQPPAEFPPSSYKGKQYVDSRGCIYIRAGIDGNVTWVPRVSRSRKQVCGYKPSQVAGATTAPAASSTKAPELITVPGATATAKAKPKASTQTTTTATATPKPAPKVTTTFQPTKPPRTTKAPIPTVAGTTTTATIKPKPAKPAPAAATAAAPQKRPAGCSNASAFSQQFINSTSDVRCGPQSEFPVTYGNGSGIGPQSSLQLTPNTRIVPAHVYEQRQNTLVAADVPKGYRRVWDDGRLNPYRAQRTLKPAVLSQTVVVPAGYRVVDRDDDRLNPMRGVRTAAGDAQTAAIWDDSVPSKLRAVDTTSARRVVLKEADADSPAEAEEPAFLFASRSAPDAPAPPKVTRQSYVRVATFSDEAQARSTAQLLARSGLSIRLGTLNRGGKTFKVVLAGPFSSKSAANQALTQVRSAGFNGARLNK